MRMLLHCSDCDLTFQSGWDVWGGTVIMVNSGAHCPNCGKFTTFPDGEYDFVGDTIAAVREVDLSKLARFRMVAEAAANGDLTADEAVKQSSEIHRTFGKLVKLSMQWGIPGLLVAILALCHEYSGDKATAQSSAQVLHALQEQGRVDEQILSQLNLLNANARSQLLPEHAQPTPQTTRKTPSAHAPTNRHQRRKAAKDGRRSGRDLP